MRDELEISGYKKNLLSNICRATLGRAQNYFEKMEDHLNER